jgi:hypothetical protein
MVLDFVKVFKATDDGLDQKKETRKLISRTFQNGRCLAQLFTHNSSTLMSSLILTTGGATK